MFILGSTTRQKEALWTIRRYDISDTSGYFSLCWIEDTSLDPGMFALEVSRRA
jgi:hypothetical protein